MKKLLFLSSLLFTSVAFSAEDNFKLNGFFGTALTALLYPDPQRATNWENIGIIVDGLKEYIKLTPIQQHNATFIKTVQRYEGIRIGFESQNHIAVLLAAFKKINQEDTPKDEKDFLRFKADEYVSLLREDIRHSKMDNILKEIKNKV